MVAFSMKIAEVLANRSTQSSLAKEDHSVQAILFDRSHKSLRDRVAVRRLRRDRDRLDALIFEYLSKLTGVLSVTIDDQVREPA